MKNILDEIKRLKKTGVKKTIDARMKDFRRARSNEEIFSELCFCIMTANFNAERAMSIQNKINAGFCTLNERALAKKLREYGHRFPNARAKHIAHSQRHAENIGETLASFKDERTLRDWLVKNVRGLGYKEASHFLRNIGCGNVAIIDFHIVDLLERNGLIVRPKTLTKKNYLAIEKTLEKLAGKANLSLAELDLYLWYMETGKVLK
ncbi:N-glycosylase/DNA lyase [Candidatus Micrarchaeota archaeon]|nr:N-glycosylase/DNA lyase [Candidatus Micrarchaeota archaeon]